LHKDREAADINRRISRILSSGDMIEGNVLVRKDETIDKVMILDEGKTEVQLSLRSDNEGIIPLISVVINGRIVFEDYFSGKIFSCTLDSIKGKNQLSLTPLNGPVYVSRMSIRSFLP
jgi:hypothetical protein